MRQLIFILTLLVSFTIRAQDTRINQIKNQLETIIPDAPGLSQKVNVNIKQATLPEFLLAVSEVHKVNISVSPGLDQIKIINNFSDVNVSDLLVFLCKEHNLTIDFTGNILAIKSFQKQIETPKEKVINVNYTYDNNLLSLNLDKDKLFDVFKKITDKSGKNIVFSPGLENNLLTGYIQNIPFEDALNKLAFSNDLMVTKTKDNFYLFESTAGEYIQNTVSSSQGTKTSRPIRSRKSNFYFTVLDSEKKLLEVDFENTPISSIVYDISNELGLDIFISNPLESAGNSSVKAKQITFEELLDKIFESKTNVITSSTSSNQSNFQNNGDTNSQSKTDDFTYTIKDNIYFFGLKNQLVLRNIKSIPLMHRSIEILTDPNKEGRTAGRVGNLNSFNNFNSNTGATNYSQSSNSSQESSSGSILSIIPKEILTGLDVKVDTELNSFIVSGPDENISRFQSFINYIDKPVPVVLIEVMLLEVNRSAVIETGISAGIGDKPSNTLGSIYPSADITLGAQTINKIINNFDGFGSLNIGNVIPNFYLSLKALESNGNVNIRSTPRLSTLNGHRAFLSIGETTYYVVTNQNYYGSQIPQTSEIKNYQAIDAELSLTLRPLISGDGQITMDIKVIQSSFNGQKVDKDAPPGINSREFTSIIRVKDQDLIVLGGLEEKVKNDTGSGVPLLSRIPIIKWFFSSRKREDSKKKLTVLIRPTVIY
ncbi:MAG: type IV pilus assembly protein PilQ [Flavobacterium sp.]|jgi:type IV pilus assembly protein PilQ